jgi:HSP20 family protein
MSEAISLRQVMDSLLEQSVVRPRRETGNGVFGLAVDVEDRGDAFSIEAALPGTSPDDVDISVNGDVLRIHAERRKERQEGDKSGRFLVREQRYGVFERAIRLPAPVDAAAAQAEFRDGVLRITLPKGQEGREQRIPIGAGKDRSGRSQGVAASSQGQHAGQGGPSGEGAREGQQRQA